MRSRRHRTWQNIQYELYKISLLFSETWGESPDCSSRFSPRDVTLIHTKTNSKYVIKPNPNELIVTPSSRLLLKRGVTVSHLLPVTKNDCWAFCQSQLLEKSQYSKENWTRWELLNENLSITSAKTCSRLYVFVTPLCSGNVDRLQLEWFLPTLKSLAHFGVCKPTLMLRSLQRYQCPVRFTALSCSVLKYYIFDAKKIYISFLQNSTISEETAAERVSEM